MPRLSAAIIDLRHSEREILETLLNRHNTPQQIALRGKIILRAAKGETHGDIAQALGVTKDTSRLWRRRWLELSAREVPVMERLYDAPRPGAPTTFNLEQITQLYAIACNPPEQYGLEEADLKPHRSGYWLNPPRLCVQIQGRNYLPGLQNRPSPM